VYHPSTVHEREAEVIESPQGIDRGLFLLAKYRQQVQKYIFEEIEDYEGCDQKKRLQKRIELLDNVIEMKSEKQNSFVVDMFVPLLRQRASQLAAFTRKAFENDPLITVQPSENTNEDGAKKLQAILTKNFKTTRFRERCLRYNIAMASRYGTYCTYSQHALNYVDDGYQTIYDPDSVEQYRRDNTQKQRLNIVNYPIHPLNIFCDYKSPYAHEMGFVGFNDKWRKSDLYKLLGNDLYDQNEVGKLVGFQGAFTDKDYYQGNKNFAISDQTKDEIHAKRGYTRLNFKDNEDDETRYYFESVNDRIICLIENPHDRNLVPLSIGGYDIRLDSWFYNVNSLENNVGQQNLTNFLLGTQIENVLHLSDRMIFAPKGAVDFADVNMRRQRDGVVFYDPDKLQNPKEQIQQLPNIDNSQSAFQWLYREIQQQAQEGNTIPNMYNKYNEGGMNNTTLGAAQMAASIGGVLSDDFLTNFSYGLSNIGYCNAVIFQNTAPDVIRLKMNSWQEPVSINKHEYLGTFDFTCANTFTVNEQMQAVKYLTGLQQMSMMVASGNPEFQGIRLRDVLKDWAKYNFGNTGSFDADRIIPDLPQQQPGAPMGGVMPPQMPGGAKIPAPLQVNWRGQAPQGQNPKTGALQ
jgi:hypothetical protein